MKGSVGSTGRARRASALPRAIGSRINIFLLFATVEAQARAASVLSPDCKRACPFVKAKAHLWKQWRMQNGHTRQNLVWAGKWPLVGGCPKRGGFKMDHSNLKVEVQGSYILVAMRGTCFRAKYRKQEAPWLATDGFGPDDPDATVTFSEFRSLAWDVANQTARRMGWVRSCDEVHKTAKRTAI